MNAKLFIVYLYGVFILNIVSIFYMNRANNSLNDKVEFLATLIIPVFVSLLLVNQENKLNRKQVFLAVLGLFLGGPLIFFTHVVLTL